MSIWFLTGGFTSLPFTLGLKISSISGVISSNSFLCTGSLNFGTFFLYNTAKIFVKLPDLPYLILVILSIPFKELTSSNVSLIVSLIAVSKVSLCFVSKLIYQIHHQNVPQNPGKNFARERR